MKSLKQIGIFMDHAHAHVMKYNADSLDCISLDKHDTDRENHHNSDKGEYKINAREDFEQKSFYHKLSEVIKDQDEVLLFGPTEAKKELLHILRSDQHFTHVKIELRNADK